MSIKTNSDYDYESVQRIIDHIDSAIGSNVIESRTATWLYSDWDAPIWKTESKESAFIDGEWVRTFDIKWSMPLPDGKLLTDPIYAKLLSTCRQAIFFHRNGQVTYEIPALTVCDDFLNDVLNLANWVVLNRDRFDPAIYSFSLVDLDSVKNLFSDLAQGGWVKALRICERIIQCLHHSALDAPCDEKNLSMPHRLPDDIRQAIQTWLKNNNAYANWDNHEKKHISRTFLSKLIGTNVQNLVCLQINLLLRQFEPLQQHPHLLITSNQRTEFPSHRTPLLSDCVDAPQSLNSFSSRSYSLITFFKLKSLLRSDLPSLPDLQSIRTSAKRLCRAPGHTPFVPATIALGYMQSAFRLIDSGENIVDLYLKVRTRLMVKSEEFTGKYAYKSTIRAYSDEFISKSTDTACLEIADINVSQYNSRNPHLDKFVQNRESPSLTSLLDIWIGAVVLLIAMFKPHRDFEIMRLKSDCLSQDDGGKFWLNSPIAKNTAVGEHAETGGRPIPPIVARAIQQMIKLSSKLKKLHQETDPFLCSLLFYLPNHKKYNSTVKLHESFFNEYLDLFCDYTALTPDRFGRRWYIRIHEMRKWFLLMFFWAGRYGVMDAARWVAGHSNADHLYQYIEREFPSEQVSELEAAWAIDQLSKLEQHDSVDVVGLTELKQNVLNQFGVSDISFIPERNWKRYVQILFEQHYRLDVMQIGSSNIEIAIRAGSRMSTL